MRSVITPAVAVNEAEPNINAVKANPSCAFESANVASRIGESEPSAVLARARRELASSDLEPEYLELVSADTLAPIRAIDGDVLAVIAARVGATRLIDNQIIRVRGGEAGGRGQVRSVEAGAPETNGRP